MTLRFRLPFCYSKPGKVTARRADRLIPVLFHELHNLARIYLKREGSGHTLKPTALVNEAYLKLIGDQARDWECRSHFIGVAATVMRRVLIDHARRKKVRSGRLLRPTPKTT